MKLTCCIWCDAVIKVDDSYNDLQHRGVCSQSCKDAEHLFMMHFSDEEIYRRGMWDKIKEEKRAKKARRNAKL